MRPQPRQSAIQIAIQIVAVAVILGIAGLTSIITGQSILLPNMAACLFLQLLLPDTPAAQPWAVMVGQVAGLLCGVAVVHLLGAAHLPVFGPDHVLEGRRAAAAILSACLTLVVQRGLRAGNAAGAALALTVALGDETADLAGVGRALAGIALVAILGEAARRLVVRFSYRRS